MTKLATILRQDLR